MKFIHSFWSKPFDDSRNRNNWNFRHNGGFPNPFLFFSAWTYSCLSIKRYYPNLHLITDDNGIRLFKDVLNLPYNSFSTELNDIDQYHKGLWALGKLHAYRLQKEPFCHLDGDVFLFGPVLDAVLKSPVFCQSFDYDTNQYAEIHPYVHKHFTNVPEEFDADLSSKMRLINAGIIGGNDLGIFRHYTSTAFELIDQNQDRLDDINSGLLNLYYEQFLFSNLVAKRSLEVASLFSETDSEPDFAAFHDIPHQSRYIHLISHLKRSTELMEQVVARLHLEFPEYYKRLKNFFKAKTT